MKTSENIQDIAKALATAQTLIKPAPKDGSNPHFKSKFASLTSIWETIRAPLGDQGLTVLQDVETDFVGDRLIIKITTRIIHTSGQWLEFGPMGVPLTKQDAQGLGSACSYGKRYALCAALGIVTNDEDDDGEKAVGHVNHKQSIPPTQPEKPIDFMQLEELKILFQQTDETFSKKFVDYMENEWKIKSLHELPARHFKSTKAAMERNIQKQNSGNTHENN